MLQSQNDGIVVACSIGLDYAPSKKKKIFLCLWKRERGQRILNLMQKYYASKTDTRLQLPENATERVSAFERLGVRVRTPPETLNTQPQLANQTAPIPSLLELTIERPRNFPFPQETSFTKKATQTSQSAAAPLETPPTTTLNQVPQQSPLPYG